MDPHRGLHSWHMDMRDARRRGFRRGIIAGIVAFSIIGYFVVAALALLPWGCWI